MYYYQQLFTFKDIDNLYKHNAIIDAKKGGLLLGPSHSQGGIYFLFEYDYGFRLFGEVEGCEYIINRSSTQKNLSVISYINDYNRDFGEFYEYDNIDNSIDIIDARIADSLLLKTKFIILDVRGGFAIINKHSTKKNLKLIDKLNKS